MFNLLLQKKVVYLSLSGKNQNRQKRQTVRNNRNFNVEIVIELFRLFLLESGVSFSPCSDVFCGEEAFSELETKAIKAYTESLTPTPILGHSIHSYSQLWLWPYGFDYTSRPDNWRDIVSYKNNIF